MGEKDPWFDRMRARLRLEHGLAPGAAAVLAATLVIVGIHVFFSSFLLTILGLRRQGGSVTADARPRMKLSVIIPAHDEVSSIGRTLAAVAEALESEEIDHELLVVDDASTDGTADEVARLARDHPSIRCLRSHNHPGFGFAIRAGLDLYEGDAAAIFMADLSDDPGDLVRYFRLLEDGFDCAFGSRFVPGGKVHDYPRLKLVINRVVNLGIRSLFRHGYNDTTNAFKAYRREVIDNIQPLLSNHFNLTVEMPLKAIVRGHSYATPPISWRNREHGASKLSLQEMGSRYLFIVLYVFLEHHLSRGDYHRRTARTARQ